MRRLVTSVLLLSLASCLLPDIAFAQTRTMFYDNLRNFFRIGAGQKRNISAASGTEKLSFRFLSSYSNAAGIAPDTKYEALNFNFQTMIEVSAKIVCLTISEKLVQPIKICTLNRINYLVTKLSFSNGCSKGFSQRSQRGRGAAFHPLRSLLLCALCVKYS